MLIIFDCFHKFCFKLKTMVHQTFPCSCLLFVSLLIVVSRSESVEYERIVSNLDDVFRGVSVDYRYNESYTSTVPQAGGLSSVPGCPKSVDGFPWVYYGSPVRCYLAGEKGPCDPEQKIFIERGSPYGFCNCECFEGISRSRAANNVEFCTGLLDNREHVFMSEKKKCFALYDQGPCKDNEWLVKSVNKRNRNVTRCESRKCPHGQIPYHDDMTEGNANNSLKFSCFSPIAPFFAGPVSILPHDCESVGMKYSKLLKKCIKKFSFSFG